MIKKLQRKFILIAAISIFLVFILMLFFIIALNVSSTNRNLDKLTDGISMGNGRFPDNFGGPPKPGINSPNGDVINPETRFSTRYFTVKLNEVGEPVEAKTKFIFSVDDALAIEYANAALEKGDSRGWISNYRFKLTDTQDGSEIIFVDGTVMRLGLFRSIFISGAVLLFAALVILLLIVVFSKKVMKPVSESYEKQKQFITDANHELKTPLTLILANIDIAEAELGKNEWLDDMRAEGNRMAALVGELVSLSRMDEEKRRIDAKVIAFSEAVSETVSEFEPYAEEKKKTLRLDIDGGISAVADETLIRRLVSILMDNAVKYCDEGGEILVSLKAKRSVTLTVENTYAAVSEIDTEKLFDRFYRGDKARTYTGSFGIGLSLAKSIAEAHSASIVVYKKDSSHIGFKYTMKRFGKREK